MNKFLRVFGSLSILVITQSFAMDTPPSSTNEQEKNVSLDISRDQLKNMNDLVKVDRELRKFFLQTTRRLAEQTSYEEGIFIRHGIYGNQKEELVQKSAVTLAHLKQLSNLYEDLENKKNSAAVGYLQNMIREIEENVDRLEQSIKLLKSFDFLIDKSKHPGFFAIYEELGQTQNQMARHFGGMKLADVAKTVLTDAAKKDGNTRAEKLKKINFNHDVSSLFGKFFLPLKTFNQDIALELEYCRQAVLRGENVKDKLVKIDSCQKIDPDFMRAQYLKMAAYAGQMLLSLYHIEPYEQKASAFSCQQKDIDSYFEHVQKYVEHAQKFKRLLDSVTKGLQDLQKDKIVSSRENYFIIMDDKSTFNRFEERDITLRSWLKSWDFTFDWRGVFNVRFEEIDTNNAKMIVSSELVENELVYHNKIFYFSIQSSDNISRPATKDELFIFNTFVALANPDGHPLIIDPVDHKCVWTIRDGEYISARFDKKGEKTWSDLKPRKWSGLFSQKKDE